MALWQPVVAGCWLAFASSPSFAQAPASDSSQVAVSSQVAGRPLDDVLRVVIKSPCFDADTLADATEEWLGRGAVDGRIQAIQIRASQGTLTFLIEVTGHPPTLREFPALPRDCQEQRSVLGLSIALAIDALEADLPPAPVVAAPRMQFSLAGVATSGWPSSMGLGGTASAEWLAAPWLGLRLSGLALMTAAAQRLRPTEPYVYGINLLAVRTDACLRVQGGPFVALAACGGAVWGRLQTVAGEPLNDSDEADTAHGWYAVALGAELRIGLGRNLGAVLGVDLLVPLARGVVQVLNADGGSRASDELPAVVGAVRLGPTLSF